MHYREQNTPIDRTDAGRKGTGTGTMRCIFAGLLIVGIAGCKPEATESERVVDSVAPTPSDIVKSEAKAIRFSTLTGNSPEWGPAPDKNLYATNSLLGQVAPDLIVAEWIGPEPNIEGKFVLIDFWATWCGPCRKAIPELNEYAAHFAEELVVIGLSDEPVGKINAMSGPKIEYYSGTDPEASTKKTVGIKGIPHVLLIDPAGKVCWQGIPGMTGHELTMNVIQEKINAFRNQ